MKIKIMKNKRASIDRNIWLGIIILLIFLLIIFSYSAVGAYSQPTTKKEMQKIPMYSYNQIGTYDFEVYLKNNTLYKDGTVLKPEFTNIFKKLIDHIDASFSYRLYADQKITINGTYKLEAQIQSELWSKTYTIIPETSFNEVNKTTFDIKFPFDIFAYEDIVYQIGHETGVIAKYPTLSLKCTILTYANSLTEKKIDTFTPTIKLPLNSKIVEFQGDLTTKQDSKISSIKTVTIQLDTSHQRAYWTIAIMILLIMIIIFAVFTKTKVKKLTVTEKLLRKIKKKYGEWIVETEIVPTYGKSRIISVKSFKDLFKISEEIGKPIFYYKTASNPKVLHIFYVFDGGIRYMYRLSALDLTK